MTALNDKHASMVDTKTNTTFVAGNNIPIVISVDDSVFSFSFTANGSTYEILINDDKKKEYDNLSHYDKIKYYEKYKIILKL